MRFEWDANKASANFVKHTVTFDEATEVFYDQNAVEGIDALHSDDETRLFVIGFSTRRLLFVVFVETIQDAGDSYRLEKQTGENGKFMSEDSSRPLVFSVVEDDGENVTIEISEEDYQKDLAAGIDEDALLKPGRYKMKRGGFLARHPELKAQQKKRA